MQGRAFLDVARTLVSTATEPYWRATVIHAYYALFLECRDALGRWGIAFTPRPRCRKRNDASYNMGALSDFATDRLAREAIQETTAALALLDAIDSDPARRAAAIAAFPP